MKNPPKSWTRGISLSIVGFNLETKIHSQLPISISKSPDGKNDGQNCKINRWKFWRDNIGDVTVG